jgi:CheY-like chemotaxis protein
MMVRPVCLTKKLINSKAAWSRAQKCVLCVDDDTSILKLREVVLNAAGYSVLTAGSGAEALGLLAEGTDVDLVLLDYLMPGIFPAPAFGGRISR